MGDQSSYLSRISQFKFVEKKLSCGEFWSFYKEFEQFMEFYQSLCRFCSKSMWRKKWQIWGLGSIQQDSKEQQFSSGHLPKEWNNQFWENCVARIKRCNHSVCSIRTLHLICPNCFVTGGDSRVCICYNMECSFQLIFVQNSKWKLFFFKMEGANAKCKVQSAKKN